MGHSSTTTTTSTIYEDINGSCNDSNNNIDRLLAKSSHHLLCENGITEEDTLNNNSHQNNNNIFSNGGKSDNYQVISSLSSLSQTSSTPSSSSSSSQSAGSKTQDSQQEYNYFGFKVQAKLKFLNIIGIFVIHLLFVYVLFQNPFGPRIWTYPWGFLIGGLGGFGVTAGAHRLWSHKAYKAKTPLRAILMICFSISGQNPLYDWVRDHRVHHKFSETEADPHDSNRGFFFAHVGWLMMNKHPEVIRKGQQLDMSDILNDPVIQFHQKYFIPLKLFLCFIIPTALPMYVWNESFFWAFYSQCVMRYVLNLNFTWLVNSAAHMWGTKPYDTRINPVQNLSVSIVAMGEGWHNYHHVFPWDYKAAELGNYFNVTAFWIDQFAKIGWAYDLKQPSAELIKNTITKYGDGCHPVFGHHMSEVPPPKEEEKNKSQ